MQPLLTNRAILRELAEKALERADQPGEVKIYCQQRVDSAFKYWEEDQHEKAIENAKDLIAILPNENFLHLFVALLFCSAKDTTKSNQIINRIPDADLTDDELDIKQFVQSCNDVHDRHFEKAIASANKIIDRNENAFYAYLPRAIALSELNEHTKAINDYKIALKEKEQVKGIKAMLAFSYMKNKNHLKAFWLHLSIFRHFKNNFRVNHHMGINFFMMNFFSLGLYFINKSIKLKPDFGEAYRSRAMIYLIKGNSKNAIEDLEKARSLGAKGIDKTLKRFNLKKDDE